MINSLDLYSVSEDIIRIHPQLSPILIKVLLSKVVGRDSTFSCEELEIEWDGESIYTYLETSTEKYYMMWAFMKILDEANELEYQNVLTDIRPSFIKYLVDVDKQFERYLGRIRGNRLKKILDIANTDTSASIVIANSVDVYHYISSDNRTMMDKYIEYCKESRTEPIVISGKNINEIWDPNADYDAIVVDPEIISEEEVDLLKSIKYKKILDITTNEFIDLKEVVERSSLPFHVTA